jgi:5-methylcytosine-specific restriction protein A
MTDVGTTPRNLTRRDKLRIWERDKGVCQSCKRQLTAADKWICEHVRALENGGTNDDENLAVFCEPCASIKTPIDHATAAKAKRQKQRSLGIRKEPTLKTAPMPKAEPQRRATRPLAKTSLPPRPMYRSEI